MKDFIITISKILIAVVAGVFCFWLLFRVAYQFLPSDFYINAENKNNDIAVLAFSVNILQMIIGVFALGGGFLAFIGYREIKNAAVNSAKKEAESKIEDIREQLKKEIEDHLKTQSVSRSTDSPKKEMNKYDSI